jgi:hypothetical protein
MKLYDPIGGILVRKDCEVFSAAPTAPVFEAILRNVPGRVLGRCNHPRIQPWIARIGQWRCSLRRKNMGHARYLIGASRLGDEYRLGPLPDMHSPSPLSTTKNTRFWSTRGNECKL